MYIIDALIGRLMLGKGLIPPFFFKYFDTVSPRPPLRRRLRGVEPCE